MQFSQVIAIFLIVAIGLDQSRTTARWRLLLMSEKEEMAWSQKRSVVTAIHNLSNVLIHFDGFSFEDVLQAEAPLLLGEDDERVQTLKRVCDRLVSVLDNENFVCAAVWPRDSRSHVLDSSRSSS
jgi:hypothetical protein